MRACGLVIPGRSAPPRPTPTARPGVGRPPGRLLAPHLGPKRFSPLSCPNFVAFQLLPQSLSPTAARDPRGAAGLMLGAWVVRAPASPEQEAERPSPPSPPGLKVEAEELIHSPNELQACTAHPQSRSSPAAAELATWPVPMHCTPVSKA